MTNDTQERKKYARKTDNALTFRPNAKVSSYLATLGFIDRRTKNKRSEAGNLSQFMNECIVIALENGYHERCVNVPPAQLAKAYAELVLRRAAADVQEANNVFDAAQKQYRESVVNAERMTVPLYARD